MTVSKLGNVESGKGQAYVVPVSLALLQCCALEFEASQPTAALLGVLGERELTLVVIPRAKKMYCLAVAGCAEREVELDGCHFEVFLSLFFP